MSTEATKTYIVKEEERSAATELIKSIMLTRCVRIMHEMISSEGYERRRNPLGPRKDKFPRTAIIKMKKDKTLPDVEVLIRGGVNYVPPAPVHIWKYEDGTLMTIDAGTATKEFRKGTGKYHNTAIFDFYTDFDKGVVYFSYSFGPLYGEGRILDIMKTEDSIYLDNERVQWMS